MRQGGCGAAPLTSCASSLPHSPYCSGVSPADSAHCPRHYCPCLAVAHPLLATPPSGWLDPGLSCRTSSDCRRGTDPECVILDRQVCWCNVVDKGGRCVGGVWRTRWEGAWVQCAGPGGKVAFGKVRAWVKVWRWAGESAVDGPVASVSSSQRAGTERSVASGIH